MNYKRQLAWLIAISTLVRIIAASTQEFGNAEAYYWVLATNLQWNYFDHPPMVAWLIRCTTLNLLLHQELFVRLGAILSAAIATWLMFKIGALLKGERVGWLAALLYATSFYSGIGIAAFILPDSPQMVFWLAALYVLVKIVQASPTHPVPVLYWVLFGIFGGLCIMCKVHGVFLWVGAIAYFLLYDRQHLAEKGLYLSLGLTFLIASPILVWNLQNQFATFQFHGGRVTIAMTKPDVFRFVKQAAQVFFLIGPVHIIALSYSIYLALNNRLPLDKKYGRLVLLCSLPFISILLLVSLFREIYAHWPGPSFSTLFLLAAVGLSRTATDGTSQLPWMIKVAVAYVLLISSVQVLSVNYFPGTLSAEKSGWKIGSGDGTLDLYGWRAAASKYDSVYQSDRRNRRMPTKAPIIITDWETAAHLDFYMGYRTGQQTVGLGALPRLHQYVWLNRDKRPLTRGDSAYYMVPSNVFDANVFNQVLARFQGFDMAWVYLQEREGVPCKAYYIVRLYDFKGSAFYRRNTH